MQASEKRETEALSGPSRIERLERMEGVTSKVFGGIVALVIIGAIVAAVVG